MIADADDDRGLLFSWVALWAARYPCDDFFVRGIGSGGRPGRQSHPVWIISRKGPWRYDRRWSRCARSARSSAATGGSSSSARTRDTSSGRV